MSTSALLLFDTSTEGFGYEPAVNIAGNEVWVRQVGDTGDGYRVAASVPVHGDGPIYEVRSGVEYEVRVVVVGLNGARRVGDWVSAGPA